MRIYLAAPLFTAAERLFNSKLADSIEYLGGHEIWLPQNKEPREKNAQAIFAMDKIGLDWAEVVVGCMDGPDPDSGTCWECGYAFAKGKPIVLFRTDMRSATDVDAPFNLMLAASASSVILHKPSETIDALADKIVKNISEEP